MLEPQDRQLLIDVLQPPSGFKLDRAVGTSYSLDLIALLSAPVAFAFADAQDRDGRRIADPLAILKATREYASRMLLFHHPGKIHVPKTYQSLLLTMENSIAEAIAPGGGSFHPKVFFLRFHNEEEVRYRFLCLSRNLTFDRSWDTSLCLEGSLLTRKNAIAANHPLGDFLQALPTMSRLGVSKEWRDKIDQMQQEIRRVEFELPDGFEEYCFWPLGIDKHKKSPFDGRCDRMLILSPFVSNRQLQELKSLTKSVQLVSRADQLQMLSRETLDSLDAIWTLKDAAHLSDELDTSHAEIGPESAETTESTEEQSVAGALHGLHAKVYVVDQGWKASVFTGSANATESAFHRNVEFMTELTGPKKLFGIDAVMGTGSSAAKQGASSLGDLLDPYTIDDEYEPQEDSLKEFQLAADRFAKDLAARALVTRCEGATEPDSFRVTLVPTRKTPAIEFDGDVEIRLLSQSTMRWHSIDFSASEWFHSDAVSLIGLTSYYVFRLTQGSHRIEFVMNAPIENPPEGRQEALLNSILSDADRVQRFLLLLLGDGKPMDLVDLIVGPQLDSSTTSSFRGSPKQALFETLMKSIYRDPDKLRDAVKFVEEMNSSEETKSRLPPDFQQIWDPIVTAWMQGQTKNRKGGS